MLVLVRPLLAHLGGDGRDEAGNVHAGDGKWRVASWCRVESGGPVTRQQIGMEQGGERTAVATDLRPDEAQVGEARVGGRWVSVATKVTVSFYSVVTFGDEVSRTQAELGEIDALITALKNATYVRFEGREMKYVDYYVDIDNNEVRVQVNVD